MQQCFMLYCKLKTVNDDVAELGGSAGLARFSRHSLHENAAATPDAPGIAVAAKDASDSVMATADAVETLRIDRN